MANAYVFGHHDGDLPEHLVQQHVPGDGVRAIVRLHDGEHDVLFSLEAPRADGLQRHIDAVREAGGRDLVVLHESGDAAALLPPLPAPPRPAWLPPSEALAFALVRVEDATEFVTRLVEALGPDSVAVWRAADGRWLVEAVADRREHLTAALDEAHAATRPSESLVHYASMRDLLRK